MREHRLSSEDIGKKRTRAVLASYMAAALVVGLVVSSNVIGLVLVFQVRDTQTAMAAQQDDIERAANAAETAAAQQADCVDKTGECYKRNMAQAKTRAVRTNEIIAAAAFCADQSGEQGEGEIQECILNRIQRDDP